VFGLDPILCQQQMASLAVLQIGPQFVCKRGPARDGGMSKANLRRILFPQTYASGTGPGGRRLDCDFIAFDDEDLASLLREVVGDGTADNSTADDQDLNRGGWMGETFAICFHEVHCSTNGLNRQEGSYQQP
jgi:hypothetical protein